jgi:chromosomal replication initiator protein
MQRSSEKSAETFDSMNVGVLVSRHVNITRSALDDADKGSAAVSNVAGEGPGNNQEPEQEAAEKQRQQTFERVCQLLRAKIGTEVYQSWFVRVQLEPSSESVIRLSVPTTFLRTWINSHYLDDLLELWQKESPSVLKIEMVVRSATQQKQGTQSASAQTRAPAGSPPLSTKHPQMPGLSQPKMPHRGSLHEQSGRGNVLGSPVDSRFTFQNFIEGPSNNVCLAAARTAVDQGANSARFNPLFFYSSVGLGKTHLLQAIANASKAKDPSKRVVYLTAEYFMWRFASAIRDSTALGFKESLNDIDLLVIDDMQFLQGEKIQSEFCHLINTLLDSAKQVVVAADRPPAELESLDPRVRSRLKGGVALEIEAPDYDMRAAMLRNRLNEAQKDDASLTIADEVLDHVAKTVSSSFRELEGAFNQLMFRHSFEPNLSLDRVDDILGHLTRAEERKKVRIEDIQRVVAQHFNVPRNEMLSNRRTRTVVRPRQIAMYLSKIMTPRSLPEIGRRFGGRDHTTVLHAVRKVEQMKTADNNLSKELELLRRLIEE